MPTVDFAEPRGNSPSEIADYIVGLRRDLNYYLMNLDTLNISRLDAKVIIARSITADKIAAGEITANEIAANTITADKLNVNQLSAISVDAGELTAGIITGLTIRTAATGRRIELSGDKLSALDSDTLDGFTLSGADGDMKYYSAGVETGGIFKDTSQQFEQLHFSHDNGVLITSLTSGFIELTAGTINVGDVGGDMFVSCDVEFFGDVIFDGSVTFNGDVDFTGANVTGLSFSTTTGPGGADGHTHSVSDNVT